GPACCLIFDLDNFKRLNDHFGHDGGDRILCLFGQTLAEHLPAGTYGRLGGEEFGAIIPAEMDDATALAETIRTSFAASGETVVSLPAAVTVSVGCATASAASPEELLRQADAALYQAKARGRNRVVGADAPPHSEKRAFRFSGEPPEDGNRGRFTA